jgi:hypothetical protein
MMDPMMDPQFYQMLSLMGGGNGVMPGRRAMGFGLCCALNFSGGALLIA